MLDPTNNNLPTHIMGIGMDALEIARMRTALTRTPSLAGRLFSAEELAMAEARGRGKYRFLAGRFAGKEAIVKALGTGFRSFAPCTITIRATSLGAPLAHFDAPSQRILDELGVDKVLVTLTSSRDMVYAQAMTIRFLDGRDVTSRDLAP